MITLTRKRWVQSLKENYLSEYVMPISKMIVEVKISDKLCDTQKDHRLSKEMICYQLGKKLERRLDTSVMTILIRVFTNMDKLVVVNIHNHQSFRLYKKGADDIKTLVAKELGGYIENPSKQIADNKSEDTNLGGPLYALLRSKGAALENTSTEDESRYEVEAKSDYKARCLQYKAFKLSMDLSKQLKETNSPYSLIVSSEKNPFRPSFYIQLMRYGDTCMWFPIDTSSSDILKTILFIEGFVGQCYINTHNGLKRKICEMLGADEYIEEYSHESELLENSQEYNAWADPRILGFINTLKENDDDDDGDVDETVVKFYEDNSWISTLGNTLFRLFNIENDRARAIVLNKVLTA